MLHLDTLEKSFGFKQILDIRDLHFNLGVHFLIGPNGAGKTTFLKCLAGIHPFRGKVRFADGIDLRKAPVTARRRINFSEAEPQFPEYLRGQELLDLVRRAKGGTVAQAQEFCRRVGIDYLGDRVGTYSSGMKKKLALLLAFVGSAELRLLDEPFSAVDQPSRKAITELIRVEVERGVTFFISSHQRDLHAAFGEGQIWLLEGKTFRPVTETAADQWLMVHSQDEETAAG
ncbi:MAG: ABC transporter ATP-binding protein [Bacteroidota bacterium]